MSVHIILMTAKVMHIVLCVKSRNMSTFTTGVAKVLHRKNARRSLYEL